MTEDVRRALLGQRLLPRPTGGTHGLIELFDGEQQAYATTPPQDAGLAYGGNDLVIREGHATTINTTTGAWINEEIQPGPGTTIFVQSRPQHRMLDPDALRAENRSRVAAKARDYRVLGGAFLSQTGPDIRLFDIDALFISESSASHLYGWNIPFAPGHRSSKDPFVANYEGVVVFQQAGSIATQSQLIAPSDETFERVLWDGLPTLNIPDRSELADKLVALNAAVRDEGNPECPGISPGSLRKFLAFLKVNPQVRLPTLSLTPQCNLYATWKASNTQVFSIHFLPGETVRFVLFAPRKGWIGRRMLRLSGAGTPDEILEVAKTKGAMEWVGREQQATTTRQ